MSEKSLPLFHYLTRANPEVDSNWSLTDKKSGAKTKSKNDVSPHDKLLLYDVFEWESIGWKKDLEPVLGDVLKLPISNMPNFDDSLLHPSHLKEIHDEKSLDALLIRWNYAVVSAALQIAQRHEGFQGTVFASSHSGEVSMAVGGQAWLPLNGQGAQASEPRKQEKALFPDWAGILKEDKENARLGNGNQDNTRHYLNILPGDTKLSTKFKSRWGWGDKRFDNVIIQVFTYCRRANVRYGYILTQEELVILRLFRENTQDTDKLAEGKNKKLYLEYKSIPWTNKGDDGLTVNLTLWCLHMLAARKKPIGSRSSLRSEYLHQKASRRSSQGSTSVSDISIKTISNHSMPSDKPDHSFSKRLRSHDRGLEESGPSRKTSRIRY